MSWSQERCFEVIERYRHHVAGVERRKRGNPPDVLKAMRILAGGKQCVECGVRKTQLHHRNGQWKDYRPDNLVFLCKEHHLAYHKQLKEIPMSINSHIQANIRTRINSVISAVNSAPAGTTKKQVFESLAPKMKVSATTVANMYYGRSGYAPYHKRQRSSQGRSNVSNDTKMTLSVTINVDELNTFITTIHSSGMRDVQINF